jgi:hypothetical protein
MRDVKWTVPRLGEGFGICFRSHLGQKSSFDKMPVNEQKMHCSAWTGRFLAIGAIVREKECVLEFTEEEIALRMNKAVRRALNTPPKPLKEIVGSAKRAPATSKSRVRKSARSKTKAP